MFRLSYKIIGLSSLNLAGRELTRLWPAGMGLKLVGQAGLGLGQTFTVWLGPGLGMGLNSSLWAWARFENFLWAWAGPGL